MDEVRPNHVHNATVVRVIDGDTIDVLLDLDFVIFHKVRLRLHGVDTPETYGVKKESEEYAKGKEATLFVEEFLAEHDNKVIVRSHDGKRLQPGTYASGSGARWIAEVYVPGVPQSLNEILVEKGLAEAVEY